MIPTTTPKIWLIQNGKKRHIPNENFLNALGVRLENGVKDGFEVLSEGELMMIPEGEPVGISDLSIPQQQLFIRNKSLIN